MRIHKKRNKQLKMLSDLTPIFINVTLFTVLLPMMFLGVDVISGRLLNKALICIEYIRNFLIKKVKYSFGIIEVLVAYIIVSFAAIYAIMIGYEQERMLQNKT